MQLILASASDGRKKLLSLLKIPFKIIPSTLDEEKIVGKTPLETIKLRAKLKGEDVANKVHGSEFRVHREKPSLPSTINYQPSTNFLILSADSGAILDNQLIGKPKDYNDAIRILKTLSGKTHEFVTAYYIIRHSGEDSERSVEDDSRILARNKDSGQARMTYKIYHGYDRSLVTFRKLTDKDIRLYLSITNYTKYAGGYAIASGQNFITKIEGSISNVIGLPLEKVIPILRENNLLKY